MYLETDRLIIRNWKKSDIHPFIEMNRNSEVMRYFPSVLTEDETLRLLARIKDHIHEWGYGINALELKSEGQFIGFTGLSHPGFESHFTPCVEIGWRLDAQYWNKELATEAAAAVRNYAFAELNLDRIYSFTSVLNTPSVRVMEKIGMSPNGRFLHPKLSESSPLCAHFLYQLEQSTWRAIT